jgi:nucleoside-diphosphate-sugar epimerase
MQPATVLVTGATGFIGSHLAERLVALGYSVRCLVRRTSSTRYLPPTGIELVPADFLTGDGLREACTGAAIVYHLAGVTKALRAEDFHTGNVTATARIVEACDAAGVSRLVHVSSLAAAGPNPGGKPLTGVEPCRPLTTYGRTKLESERIVHASAIADRAVIVRPPVVYGPRDTDVLHMFRAAQRGLMLAIGREEHWFSIIHVRDLVEGILAAGRAPGAAGGTYYLTQAAPLSWDEFFSTAANLFGRKPRKFPVPRSAAWLAGLCAEQWCRWNGRPGIVSREKIAEACCRYWTCDATPAARDLGFKAATGLREGMTETIAWYRKTGWLR